MNVLITGNIFSLATSLAREFLRQGNKTVIVSEFVEQLEIQEKGLIKHSISPTDNMFHDIFSAYKFDTVIYISTREEQLLDNVFFVGENFDGLKSVLDVCKSEGVGHFFYISSTEVYGAVKGVVDENVEPQAFSDNGHALILGEQVCTFYYEVYDVKSTIVRVPLVYSPYDKDTLLYKLILQCKERETVKLPFEEDTVCSMLHANDVANFLTGAIQKEFNPDFRVINLSSKDKVTLLELSHMLKAYFPNTRIDFENNTLYTRPISVFAAKKIFNWEAVYNFSDEMPGLMESFSVLTLRKYDWEWALDKLSLLQKYLKWPELVLGALVAQYLSELTGIMIQFKYVDFRLFYVVIMSMVYGLQFGLLASVLAGASIIYSWSQLGADLSLLTYTVGNWFPFSVYFATGVVVGFIRDKKETEIQNEKKQTLLIYDKYKFLYEVFEEVRVLKDEFRGQLLGYKDSFGKIYTVTQKLDTLQEEDVFVNALSILEELLSNKTVAIYSLDSTKEYARLEVNSISLKGESKKSIRLNEIPDILDSVDPGCSASGENGIFGIKNKTLS